MDIENVLGGVVLGVLIFVALPILLIIGAVAAFGGFIYLVSNMAD